MPPPRAFAVLENGAQIVLISPFQSEAQSLQRILGRSHMTASWHPTHEAALVFLREQLVGVVISDAEVPDGSWKDLLKSLSDFEPSPNLIVSSRLADDRLWAEVLNLGATTCFSRRLSQRKSYGSVLKHGSRGRGSWRKSRRCEKRQHQQRIRARKRHCPPRAVPESMPFALVGGTS